MKVTERDGDKVTMETREEQTIIEMEGIRVEMHAASLYSTEEKLPMTKICQKL
jgi:hypothetical protein